MGLAGSITTQQYRSGPINPDLPRWDQSKDKKLHDIFLNNICQDSTSAPTDSICAEPEVQEEKQSEQLLNLQPEPTSEEFPSELLDTEHQKEQQDISQATLQPALETEPIFDITAEEADKEMILM